MESRIGKESHCHVKGLPPRIGGQRKGRRLQPLRFTPVLLLATASTLSFQDPCQAESLRSFAIRGQLPHVSMLNVSPGAVVPLETFDPETKRRIKVRWTFSAGSLSTHQNEVAWKAPDRIGVYQLLGAGTLEGRPYRRTLTAYVAVPADGVKDGSINGYHVGRYPGMSEPKKASRAARSFSGLPTGFIRFDAESAKTRVSPSFTLGQFAVKDGPRADKYMFLDPRLIEKLECVVDALRTAGSDPRGLRIMSGYRTPAYNEGIGNKTSLSRHTYGDAADVLADDWDHDGTISRADAMMLYRIADRLDRTTDLKGGLSLYPPTSQHGWFVHVDARGRAARW